MQPATWQTGNAGKARPSIDEVEALLRSSLSEFASWLNETKWRARENECVNVFAHHFMAGRVQADGPLYDLAQIGIEVAVPQVPRRVPIPGKRQRHDVRKDLVLWPHPGMHAFDPLFKPSTEIDDITPAAVVEWKVRATSISEYDLEWLEEFTKKYRRTLGIAVSVKFTESGASLKAVAVKAGETNKQWLSV